MKTGLWGLLIASGGFNCPLGALDRPLKTLDRSLEALDPLLEALDRGPTISKMAEKPHPGFGQIFKKKMVSGHHLDISGDLPANFLASEAFPGADPHMGPPGPRKKIQFES